MKIEEVLARRSDLSTFLVHLCRDWEEKTARERLEAILRAGSIRAFNPMGHAVEELAAAAIPTDSQRTVCFTETPLEHTSLLCEEIENRQCQFKPYGIAITKKQGRKRGVNPVWYLDITQSTESTRDWLTKPINELVKAAITDHRNETNQVPFEESSIGRLTPFIEQMGSGIRRRDGESYRKEFWWEREWRHIGDFHLPKRFVAGDNGGTKPVFIVLCPEEDFENLKSSIREGWSPPVFIDPRWSLEQIIARTAGFEPEDVGPM